MQKVETVKKQQIIERIIRTVFTISFPRTIVEMHEQAYIALF